MRQRDFRVAQLNELNAAPESPSTDVVHRQVRNTLLDATRSVLADIEAALRLIERGTYGRCDACGVRMPEGRLAVLPMARLCSECQQNMEQNAGNYRRASERATVGKAS